MSVDDAGKGTAPGDHGLAENSNKHTLSAYRLRGRIALVTGAARNIGRAIATRLAAEGATVIVNDIDADGAKRVARDLVTAGYHARPSSGDMSSFEIIEAVFTEVEASIGPVDTLVNNAYARVGATSFGPFLHVEPADWELFVTMNMNMLFGCTSRATRRMVHDGIAGSVINVSSHGAERAHRNHIPYDSMKGATDAFTRAVAVDLAPWGIRVNGIRPGTIEVDNDPGMWSDKGDMQGAQIPLGRPGEPDDIAGCAAFLASDDAGYVTGQVIDVDGGFLVQGRAPQMEGVKVATPANIGAVDTRIYR